jgi:hypothetical protein
MKKICMFVFLASFVALIVSGPQAFAETKVHHWHVVNGPHAETVGPAPTANLYGAGAFFTNTPLNQAAVTGAGGSPTNSGNPWNGPWPGTNYPVGVSPDLWPCFGADTANGGDCLTIDGAGNGFGSYPGEVVLGTPSYTWYLDANTATAQPYGCNATAAADEFHFCAQAVNFYEDDSNDTTDDLLWSMTVTQVQGGTTKYLYDSGTQDYGANPYGGLLAANGVAPVVVFYEDLNLGLLGGTGSDTNGTYPEGNIGPCFASYNYPINNAPNAFVYGQYNTFGANWGIAGGKDCVAPEPGLATVTITTELETPTFKELTNTTAKPHNCPGEPVGGTCYTVTYKALVPAISAKQSFNIWLR